jgi:hypothetical protein
MMITIHQLAGGVEMPDTSGPVYQLTVQGTIFDQAFVNVFYYLVEGGPGIEADAIGSAFKIGILPNICGVQNVAVEYQNIQVVGARDSTDVADINIRESVGLITGDCLPPFVAWSFIITRQTTEMRNGYKRFPGVSETWQLNGEVVEGTPEDTLVALGDTLRTNLEVTTLLVGELVVPRRQWHSVPLEPVQYWHPADVNFHGITTQNTRKFGRS